MKTITSQHVVIIGAGFGGLATAALLAETGMKVTVVEKNEDLGGRARVWESKGYRFDMGPSWYLMPDVFEHFFDLLGVDIKAVLPIKRLSPSYRVFLPSHENPVDMYSDVDRDGDTLERLWPGSGQALRRYMKTSKSHYDRSLRSFMLRNADTFFHYMTWETMRDGWGLPVLISMEKHLSKWFRNDTVRRFLAYQTLFLGNAPKETPGVFSAMNYVDYAMGVHYPEGGIASIVNLLAETAVAKGACVLTGASVATIRVEKGRASAVILDDGRIIACDIVVANADYHHVETTLLTKPSQTYPEDYWNKKRPAPSAAILYLGLTCSAPLLQHHTLLFPQDWDQSFRELFSGSELPSDPSIYICCPSKTDPSVAPEGATNLFILMPTPTGVEWNDSLRKQCEARLLSLLESQFGFSNINEHIAVKRFYCGPDFKSDYNAWKSNALGGMAHTLGQSSFMRPAARSKRVKNLFYVGAGTNPGIGMPMCLLSAEMLVKRLFGIGNPGMLPKLPKVRSAK